MGCTMFKATKNAADAITRTFDLIWAIDAGLWRLRRDTNEYSKTNPNATESDLKSYLVDGLKIHGLNARRVSQEFEWEDEEQYIAELLLINAISVFDTWVDNIVETGLTACSNSQKKI